MVGVCFWLLSVVVLVESTSKECSPPVCRCLKTFVDCSSTRLETIPNTIPKSVTHLLMRNNSIKDLDTVDWKKLSELTELSLTKNNIATIPKDSFHYQKHLKILEINRNKLREVEALTFKSLENLTTLKLRRNQITQLKDGAFYGLASIQKLILDYNHLQTISNRWLYGLDTLKELSLSHNNINYIEHDSWECCKTLAFLDLSSNQLKSIETDNFKNLGDLQKLILSNNSIAFLRDNAFVHLPKLKILDLSYNQLWWAVEDANGVFRGMNDLTKFYMTGNNIKSINRHAFVGLKNVTHLRLGENNITSIQRYAFSYMPMLKDLVMNTSSLICDCHLAWYIDWLNNKSLKIEAICAYPEWLEGQSLYDVAPNNFTCFAADDLPKPRLIQEPEPEIMALKGENVSLSCKAVSSSNSMKFQWKKNNVELVDGVVTIESRSYPDGKTTETTSHLNLRQVKHSDAGKYQCVVSNNFGKTYSKKSNLSVLVYPTFVRMPSNVTVKVGETAKLACAAKGEPPPEIAWHKADGNNFPAASERRMHVMPTDDVFFIIDTKPIDMGIYSCTAHNAAGTIVANASLTIEEKPYFIKSMENKEVSAGESVVLQCMGRGVPKPSITWLKESEVIARTERHFFTAEDQLMVIVDTVQPDTGTYECRLNNSLGVVSDHSNIVVKPCVPNTNNMMGIIIITVVCCAVLTSIIWVVIIYQTRRKNARLERQIEIHDFPDQSLTLPNLHHFPDNISDHSSCKDSGTGDSAKRSNDDLVVPEEFTMILQPEPSASGSNECNNSHVPLLHSTNHDRTIQIETEAQEPHAEQDV